MDSQSNNSYKLAARGNKGINIIRRMFAEGNSMNMPDKIISLGIGAPHLIASPLIDTTQREFLDEKERLMNQLNSDSDKTATTKQIIALETYLPANGRSECQAMCAELVNSWYPDLKADADHIIITNGCTQGLMCVMHTLVEPGVGVCAFIPYFPPYVSQTVMFGGHFVGIPTVNCRPIKELFEQTLRENPDIGLLILNDPVNPSGVKLSKEELIEIGEVLTKPEFSNIFILIDDTYHELCYGDAPFFLNTFGLEKFKNRIAIAGCLSKCLGGAPGLRAGFLYGCDIIHQGTTINFAKKSEVAMLNTTCAVSSIVSYSLQEVLKAKFKLGRSESDHILQIEWENNGKSIYSGLLNAVIRNFGPDSHFPLVVKPEAAFFSMIQSKIIGFKVLDSIVQLDGTQISNLKQYVKTECFETDLDVALFMLRAAYVILVPASDFGIDAKLGYMRISCAISEHLLDESFRRIEFVAKQITGKS